MCGEWCLVLLVRNPPFEIAKQQTQKYENGSLGIQVKSDDGVDDDPRKSARRAKIFCMRNISQFNFHRVSRARGAMVNVFAYG